MGGSIDGGTKSSMLARGPIINHLLKGDYYPQT